VDGRRTYIRVDIFCCRARGEKVEPKRKKRSKEREIDDSDLSAD